VNCRLDPYILSSSAMLSYRNEIDTYPFCLLSCNLQVADPSSKSAICTRGEYILESGDITDLGKNRLMGLVTYVPGGDQ
jgi:hypothetical protein